MPERCTDGFAALTTRHSCRGGNHDAQEFDMSEKKAYPLRINADVLAATQRWADDELRSLNAQIEYVLRDSLRKAGRIKPKTEQTARTRKDASAKGEQT